MSSLKDLLNQIETLQNQVSAVRQKEVGEAISKVRILVEAVSYTHLTLPTSDLV